jgi:hypothetical protein
MPKEFFTTSQWGGLLSVPSIAEAASHHQIEYPCTLTSLKPAASSKRIEDVQAHIDFALLLFP